MGRFVTAVLVAGALVIGACGSGDSDDTRTLTDEQRQDDGLVLGETIYQANCATCHGASGGGGNGPSFDGISDRYPEVADHMAIVENGRAGMPGFGSRLSAEEIESVVRYEREVLDR